jgi:predicted ATP-grasp superfamily ATP-dependent carboligase
MNSPSHEIRRIDVGPVHGWRHKFAVLEAVTAGLCGAAPEPSLLAEGRAMWSAVVAELARITDATVTTVVDPGLVSHDDFSGSVRVFHATGDRQGVWNRLCDEATAAIIIAPETDGLLADLVTAAQQRPALRIWNASPAAIRLTTDKLQLAQHLLAHGIRTLPTAIETWTEPPTAPCVLKPRDGAGSWLVRRVDDESVWRKVREEFAVTAPRTIPLRQPYVRGRAVSIAGWFGPAGIDWLPIAEQRLSDDGTFRYLGGCIPAAITAAEFEAVRTLVVAAAATLPRLTGYIGFDILLPHETPDQPLLVEINPRFTTSYVGYCQWSGENLLARWLHNGSQSAIRDGRAVVFEADGRITEESPR